jgi:hypothetical protein
MNVGLEMLVNDTQRHFFQFIENGIEQCLRGLVPSIDAFDDILLLNYERVVAWEFSRYRP